MSNFAPPVKVSKSKKGEAAFKITDWSLKPDKYSPTEEQNSEAEKRLKELNNVMGKAKFKELMTSMSFEISEKIRHNPVAKLLYILGNSDYGRAEDYSFALSIQENKSGKKTKEKPKESAEQVKKEKKQKKKSLKVKPVKILHHTAPAGTLLKGEAGLLIEPLNLEIDLGMGGLFLSNLDSGQFFFSPAISGTHGGDFSFSWLYTAGIMLEGKTKPLTTKGHKITTAEDHAHGTNEKIAFPTESETKVTLDEKFYHHLYLAFTYDIDISDKAGLTLLAGSGGMLGHDRVGTIETGQFSSDVALSINVGDVSLYDIVSMTWSVPKAAKQHITDLQPFFQQNVVGVYGSLPKGHGIYAEWTHDVFFDEVVLGGEFLTKIGKVDIAVSGKKENKVLGEGYFFGLKMNIPIGIDSTTYAELSSETEFGTQNYQLVEYDVLDLEKTTTITKVIIDAPEYILEDEDEISEAQQNVMDNHFPGSSLEGVFSRHDQYDELFPEYAYLGDSVLYALGISETFDEFIETLGRMEMSVEDYIIMAATLAGIGRRHYSEQLKNESYFSEDWKKWSGISHDDVYATLREALANGEKIDVGICVHINGMAVEFLNKNGIEAYGVTIPMSGGAHHVAFATDKSTNKSYILDYGELYQGEGNMLDLLRTYASLKGIEIDSVYLYGKQGEFIGLYTTPEGELIQEAITPIGKTKKEYLKGLLKSKIKKIK